VVLEQIEKFPDLVVLLKDAVNFYISHIVVRKTESEEAISGLSEIVGQVDQMTQRRDLVQRELDTLRTQKHQIEKDFDDQKPYLNIVGRIKNTQAEISERRAQLRTKDEVAVKKKQVADSQPGNKLLAEDAERAAAFLHGEKVGEEFIIERLVENLAGYNKRLEDVKVDPEKLQAQVKDIRTRTRKLTEVILAKEKVVTNIDNFLKTHNSELDRLEELKWDFEGYEVIYDNLTELIKILSEVPVDGTIIPATEKAAGA